MTTDTREPRPFFFEPLLAVVIAAVALLLTGCMENQPTQVATFPETKAVCAATAIPNSYVVRWKDGSSSVYRGYTREDFKAEVFDPNKDDIAMAEQDQQVQIQPYSVDATPTATVDETWGQSITGATTAWAAGVYGDGVVVAVVDSGVDLTHPQLAGRIHVNSREIPGNGIDDDGNGYIDDVRGWDFEKDSPEVGDGAGHGTHVSGIIAADHNTGSVKGVAPHAEIMPLDFMNSQGAGAIGDAIQAIQYAADNGAKVINASWGGAPCSQTLQKTINDLAAKGIVFVAAAGNSGVNLDQLPEYPAAFTGASQITVGASTARDYTASFSNFSYRFVSLFAPGAAILSTYPGARTATMSGTSMAAPFVSGAAALLISKRPEYTAVQVKNAILQAVDHGDFAAATQGRLDIPKSL